MNSSRTSGRPRVRFGVVGAGHITQIAMLPGFANAECAELVALVSGDPTKRTVLGKRYGIPRCVGYQDYEALLDSGEIDAVYIALPNHLHCRIAVAAVSRGIHVLCEKPMAVTEEECEEMMRAADDAGVSFMVAYRLHFTPAHLEAIAAVEREEIGAPRFFTSSFSQNVEAGNIRLGPVERGGGPVYDLGIYCINAARYLFQDEPIDVVARKASRDDLRFAQSPETVAATLCFPGSRIASFVVGFGSAETSRLEVVGELGRIVLDPAYEYDQPLRLWRHTEEGVRAHAFERQDQFGAELVYFCECIIEGRRPEPDALSGLADVHIIRAIHQSAETGRPVKLLPIRQPRRPEPSQAVIRPPVQPPEEVHAASPRAR